MQAKKSVHIFMSLVLGIIILFLFALYLYDPLQIFHKAWGRDTTFQKNMRLQAAGIINNYEFDSVILGTSMLENSSANEASTLFGGKFVNISMPGSDFFERKHILEHLLHKKNIHKVIYSLDSDKFIYQIKGYKRYPLKNFSYLYDQNPFNDINAYLNTKECTGAIDSLDRPGAWYKSKRHSIRYGGLDKWFAANNNYQIKNAFKKISSTAKNIEQKKRKSLKKVKLKIESAKKYIDENILYLVKKYPDTEFIFASPPYSRIYYAMWAQYDFPAYEIHKAILKYMAQKSDEYHNLQIFVFGDQRFVDEIKNYKDPKHYHVSINDWILQAINKDIGRINSTNIDPYIETVTRKNKNYDLLKLGQKIDNYLYHGR